MEGRRYHLVLAVAGVAMLCLLEGGLAMPNPDFGINANINTGRSDVVNEAIRLASEFATVDDYTVTLVGGYTLLEDVQSAVVAIGDQFLATGMTLAQRLNSLATDNGPNNVNGVFDPVYGGINNLKSLMATGLNDQLSSLNDLTGPFITQKFGDAFEAMRKALDTLTSKLQALQDAVVAARAAYSGMGPVPASIVRARVPSRVQNSVVSAIVEVRTRIGVVRFMVSSTLMDLETADEFLGDVTEEAQDEVEAMHDQTLDDFSEHVGYLREDVVLHILSSVSCVFSSQLSDLSGVQDALSMTSAYADSLQESLGAISFALGTSSVSSQTMTLSGFFNAYVSGALALQDDLESFFRGETCAAVQETILALVAGGPYNRYCFYKYSDRVYNLYEVHFYAASKCYEVEFYRLATLADALEDLIDLVLYDVEDLVYRLDVCAHLLVNNEACVTTLGGLYGTLFEKMLAKIGFFMSLAEHELVASYNRLAACVTSARYSTVHSVGAILHNLERCKDHGAPDGTDDSNQSGE